MKHILFIVALIAGIFTASARGNYSREIGTLPPAAQTLIKTHFKADVNHIKVEKDLGINTKYDVVLNDGTEITFDKGGNWKEIEVRKGSSVPDAFIPADMKNYIKQNQKGSAVIGIEKKRGGYEVELTNGVEMKFDSNGKFVRYDD